MACGERVPVWNGKNLRQGLDSLGAWCDLRTRNVDSGDEFVKGYLSPGSGMGFVSGREGEEGRAEACIATRMPCSGQEGVGGASKMR